MDEIRIIGISGRIGSGKDTVGEMIQRLTSFGGEISYEAGAVMPAISNKWHIKKFAAKLKEVAHILTGIPVEKFEDQEFKQSLLGSEWGAVEKTPLNSIPPFEDVDFNNLMSVRELLQKLGTDAIRDGLHTNAWVNALWADYYKKISPVEMFSLFWKGDLKNDLTPNWIITDVRFSNEAQSIKDRGGLLLRLRKNEDIKSDHVSETALDKFDFDHVIDNREQTLAETEDEVKVFLAKFNIKQS